jgi:hypothetical protein
MVEVLPDSKGNILALRARGLLTHQDYRRVIIPRLEAMIRGHGKVRFLLENFQGWGAVAFWDDARFGLMHRNDFEKIALIGGPKCVLWALNLVALVVSGEMRTFSASERSKALSWIRA